MRVTNLTYQEHEVHDGSASTLSIHVEKTNIFIEAAVRIKIE
jgi:hypothetical protein